MADDKIIERIRALLAMAADTSSPNEASIAAGRARKLMDQHQVGLEDLKDSGGFGFAAVGKEYRFMPKWLDVLAVGVAYLNDCKVIKQHNWKTINSSYSYQLVFQGYEQDVQIAVAIYDYLVEQVTKQCYTYMRQQRVRGYVASIGDPYKRGAAGELQRRMQAMQKERQADPALLEHKTGTALVVFKMKQVEAEFGAFKTVTKGFGVKLRHDKGLAAMNQGQADGRNMEIHRRMES